MIWIFLIREESIRQIWEKIIGYCYKNRTRCYKLAPASSKKVVHKIVEATGELIGNKIPKKCETKT